MTKLEAMEFLKDFLSFDDPNKSEKDKGLLNNYFEDYMKYPNRTTIFDDEHSQIQSIPLTRTKICPNCGSKQVLKYNTKYTGYTCLECNATF